jgi:hypothetical protein
MTEQKLKTQDADARAFYGMGNTEFDAQIKEIAGHDPRLLAALARTRAWYLVEKDCDRQDH